jgi:hypothetical protein
MGVPSFEMNTHSHRCGCKSALLKQDLMEWIARQIVKGKSKIRLDSYEFGVLDDCFRSFSGFFRRLEKKN